MDEQNSQLLMYSALHLPDGGAKLRAKLEQITAILNNEDTAANIITNKVSGLSLNEKMDIRKETIVRSNNVQEVHAHNLLRAHDADEQHVSYWGRGEVEKSLQLTNIKHRQEQHV